MAGSLGDIFVSLSADTAQFEAAFTRADFVMQKSMASAKSTASSMEALSDKVTSVGASLAGVVSIASIASALEDTAVSAYHAAVNLQYMSERTGTSIATLSAIRDASTISGASLDVAAGSMDKLAKAAAGSANGAYTAADAFKILSISTVDVNGNTKDSGTLFEEVALALDHFQDGANKTAIVMALMGRGAAENIPLLHQMAVSIGESNTITPEAAANAVALQVAWGTLKVQSEAAANSIIDSWIPALTQLIEKLTLASGANVTFADKIKFWASSALAYETLGLIQTNALDVTARLKEVTTSIDDIQASLAKWADVDTNQSRIIQGNLNAELALLKQKKALLDDAAIKNALNFAAGLGDTSDHGQYTRPGGRTALPPPPPSVGADSFAEVDKLRSEMAALDEQTAKYNDTLLGLAATDTSLNKVLADYDLRLVQLTEQHKTLSGAESQLWDDLAKSAIRTDAARIAAQAHNDALALTARFMADAASVTNAATSATTAYTDKIADQVSKFDDEVTAIGMSSSATKILTENRKIDIDLRTVQEKLAKDMADLDKLETAALFDQTGVLDDLVDAMRDQIRADVDRANAAAASAKIRIAADVSAQDSFSSGWAKAYASYKDGLSGAKIAQDAFNAAASSFETLIVSALSHGANAWQTFKNSALTALEQITAKMATSGILQLLTTGGISLSGFSGAAGASTGASGAGSIFGNLGGAAGGLSSIFGASDFTAALAGDAFLPGALGASGAGVAAFGSTIGALGATLSAALPVIGIAIAAFALFSALGKGGGPKVAGASAGSGYYPGETDTGNNATIDAAVATINTDFSNALAALGGQGSATFNLGYDTDPQGTAQNRITDSAIVNGQSVYGITDQGQGRDAATLQASLATEAQRMLLAALQASNLPSDVAKLLNSVSSSTATGTQVQNIIAQAEALKTVNDLIARNPMVDALKGIQTASQSAATTLAAGGTALLALAANYDKSAAASQSLTASTNQYYSAVVAVIAQIQQIKTSISGMFTDTIQTLTLATLDNAGKQSYYSADEAAAEAALATSTDPATVQALATRINNDFNAVFGLLTPAQQQAQLGDFTTNLGKLNTQITAQLTTIQQNTAATAAGILTTIQTALQKNADQDSATANVNASAAQINLQAALTPITIQLPSPAAVNG